MMASALALMSGAAYAQQSPPPAGESGATPIASRDNGDRVQYEKSFFDQFNPQTALDMVRQTPGFSLDDGDDRRGFSGAVGNLLIDGLRPSSKNQSLDTLLSQIPANQVVRIELLRGTLVAGDASGQSVLLNVVRTPSAGSGVFGAGVEYTSREVPAPRGNLSYSGRNGQVEYGIGLNLFSQYRDLPGWRRIYDGAGNHIENIDTPSPRDFREVTLNGNLAFPLAGGRLSARGQVNWFRYHADNDFISTTPAGAPIGGLYTVFEEEEPSFEVGLDYDRALGPWTLSLIGLVNREYYESVEDVDVRNALDVTTETAQQAVENEEGETILRAALSRDLTSTQRIELGAEGAFNSLDAQLAYTRDTGSGPTPILIPNSNVLVEEERAEFFGVHTWRPSADWSIETRLAWETSTLSFEGDANQSVDLNYWKPSVQITRTLGGDNQLRLRAYRDVGQLDFGDFTSNAAIADAMISGGNPDLVPQTAWRAEIGADLRFWGAALSLTLTQHWIEDVADLVRLTDTNGTPDPSDDSFFDAPGNIGDGEATSLDVNFNAPLSPLIPGGRITVRGYLWDTEVTDPVTGNARIISDRPESEINIEFRQDFPALRMAWGVNIFKQGEFQIYRYNEIDTNEEGPWIDIFWETTALPNNMRLRLWAANAFDGTVNRVRHFYGPDRTGPRVRTDLRERKFAEAPWVIAQISGTF
ncbi:MAG TPA: TonB-dependent receptor [Terricaulis sp.]|nr:TonB-dependent receptor [Terricaulis sp.]